MKNRLTTVWCGVFFLVATGLVLLPGEPRSVSAQPAAPALTGTATTQGGRVLLPGVSVLILDSLAQIVATAVSDETGHFSVSALSPGRYQLTATIDGFAVIDRTIRVDRGAPLDVLLAFDLTRVSETVEVVSPLTFQFTDITAPVASREVFDTAFIEESPTADDSIESALPLLPGVIRGPDGINIKGGRPTQSSLQLGSLNMGDPATGNAVFTVPASGIASVEVLPNPYAVEFGRFTSGVTVIQPKRGGDTWEMAVNNPFPAVHTERGEPFHITGIRGFSPSFTLAGPLVPGRLFLAQSGQYRFSNNDVRSRPQSERRTQESLNSFTRLDTVLPGNHRLSATVSLFPEELTGLGLDTFNPPSVTPAVDRHTHHASVTHNVAFSGLALLETTMQAIRHRERVGDNDTGILELLPEENRGHYFTNQDRRTNTYQWLGSWSGFHRGASGDHLFKVGADLLHARFDGEMRSAPVEVRRLDETLTQRIEYSDTAPRQLHSTDTAIYAQDRWQTSDRLLFEFGVRLERDGVLNQSHVTPRVGAAVNLNETGTMAVRGGIGLFYERTPSTAGMFDQFEHQLVTNFGTDGQTPLGRPVLFVPTQDRDLRTARSRTWHVEYRHQVTPSLSVAVTHLRRRGRHELIVERQSDPTPILLLSSHGQSSYHETGVEVRFVHDDTLDVDVSYVHSAARGDLNAFSTFFNTVRQPLIRANAFAPTDADVPHRLIARTRLVVADRWQFVPLVEIRNGFPYTPFDERREFIGPRNRALRFPTVARFNIAAERQIRLGKWRPWLGVRVLNVFDRFEPLDVQRHIDSPNFGQFFNAEPIRARVTVRVQL